MHLFVSYPKSGRTWVRFMTNWYLDKALGFNCGNVLEVEERIKATPQHVEWTHLTGAMLFNLQYYQMGFDFRQLQGKPCTLLVRNFIATMASAYEHARYRKQIFEGDPAEFVRSPKFGIIKMVTLFNLVEDISPLFSEMHVFTYEALRDDTPAVLTQIISALGHTPQPELIADAVEAGTMANMQQTAADPKYHGSYLAESDPNNEVNQHVNMGSKKKWRDLFSDDDLDYMHRVIDDLLVHKDRPYLEGMLSADDLVKRAQPAA